MSFWSCGLQIRVAEGPNKGRTFPLDAQEITVGRARTPSDRAPGWILLNDDHISRIHLDLKWNESERQFVLHHRSETNPTFLNGQQISEPTPLKPGDQVRLGMSVLDLQQADFRFGGMDPSQGGRPARTLSVQQAPAGAAPPNHLAMRNNSVDNEAESNTRKPARVAALTLRPKFHLQIVKGPEAGKKFPITGLVVALGGSLASDAPEPEPPADGEEAPKSHKWYDQEVALADSAVGERAFALAWKELENGFLFSRTRALDLSVTLERKVDGADWIAELPESSVMLRAKDLFWLGESALQIALSEET